MGIMGSIRDDPRQCFGEEPHVASSPCTAVTTSLVCHQSVHRTEALDLDRGPVIARASLLERKAAAQRMAAQCLKFAR